MTLPKKTLLAIGIAFTGLIGGLYAASSTILLNSLRQAEEQNTRQAVTGVLSVFSQTQADFSSRLADWSSWNDTYVFIKDFNRDYIESNLMPESIATLKINLMLYSKPSGRIVVGTGFDLVHRRKTPVSEVIRTPLSPHDILLRHPNTRSSLEGIMLLPEGPMMIVSRPIVTSEVKGPIRGTLIFGRLLDADEIARLSRIARLSLKVHALNETKLPPDFQAVRNSLSDNSILVRPLNNQTIAGYALLRDIYGKPALLLRVDMPRDIYQQGQNSLRYLITSLLIVVLLFGGITLLLMKRLLLSQRQQQQSEERYRTVVAQAAEGIFLVDASTKRILETNAAFDILLSYTSVEVRKLTIYDVIADERESIDLNFQRVLMKHHFTGEQQYRRQDGLLVDVEVNANLISDDEKDIFCIIIHDITKRKQVELQLLHDASHDSLTDLANRALFIERLEQALQHKKRREDYFFAVLFVDLDRFKVVNDSLGHMVGDQLLIAIAQRLKRCLRSSDTFARLGGDEFTVLLEDNQGDRNVTQIVERIQQELKLPFNLNGQEIFATASIGVILNTTDYDRPEDLLRDADIAMYHAKAQGRACHQVFDVAMHEHAVALLQLDTDLRRAVDNQEFQLHYQPIVSLASHKISGLEALVRWQHAGPTRLVGASGSLSSDAYLAGTISCRPTLDNQRESLRQTVHAT